MSLGSWTTNVIVGGMPEAIATAFGKIEETLVGASYTPIAYLGSQLVNGVNHAVLAEQLILSGKDTKNVVLMIFNEKKIAGELPEVTLVSIERVVEGGDGMGGTVVDVKTDIPEDAAAALTSVLATFTGSTVKPFALLATQVVKGINYVFAAEVAPVVPEPESKVCIVTVNAMDTKINFVDVLASKQQIALGAPLGEWP